MMHRGRGLLLLLLISHLRLLLSWFPSTLRALHIHSLSPFHPPPLHSHRCFPRHPLLQAACPDVYGPPVGSHTPCASPTQPPVP